MDETTIPADAPKKRDRQSACLLSVENSLRPVALGRKNYLFAHTHEAARRSGMLYSLPGTCKINGLEPYGWLKDALHRIAGHPINRIQELLPLRSTTISTIADVHRIRNNFVYSRLDRPNSYWKN